MANPVEMALHLVVAYAAGQFLAGSIGEPVGKALGLFLLGDANRDGFPPEWQVMRDKLIEEGSRRTRVQAMMARPRRSRTSDRPSSTPVFPSNVVLFEVPKDTEPDPPDAA